VSASYDDDGVTITLKNNGATDKQGRFGAYAAYYWDEADNKIEYPVSNDNHPIEVNSKYAFDDTAAEEFTQTLYEMQKSALVQYSFGSEENYEVGTYCDLTLAEVGLLATQVRIVSKDVTEELPVIKYIAEGIGEIGAITASVVAITNSTVLTAAEVQSALDIVNQNLSETGLTTPISSLGLDALGVSAAALYFNNEGIGYFDGTDWTVYIANDGTFFSKVMEIIT